MYLRHFSPVSSVYIYIYISTVACSTKKHYSYPNERVLYDQESITTQRDAHLYPYSSDTYAWKPPIPIVNNRVHPNSLIHSKALTHINKITRYDNFSIDRLMLDCMHRFVAQNLLKGFLPKGCKATQLSRESFVSIEGWLVGVYYGKQLLIFSPVHAIQYIIDTGKENNLNFKKRAPRNIKYEPLFLALCTAIDNHCQEAIQLLTYNLQKKTCSIFLTIGDPEDPSEPNQHRFTILSYLLDNMTKHIEKKGYQCPYCVYVLEYLVFQNKVDPTRQDPYSKDNILHELVFNNGYDTLKTVLNSYKKHIKTRTIAQKEDKFSHLEQLSSLLNAKSIDGYTPLELAKAKLREDSPIIPLLDDANKFVNKQHITTHSEGKGVATCSLCLLYRLPDDHQKRQALKRMHPYQNIEEHKKKYIKTQ